MTHHEAASDAASVHFGRTIRRTDMTCLCCVAEIVLIGNDARSVSAQLSNQLAGISNRAVLMTGRQTTVRHSVGVMFGFIVGFSASPPPSVTSVRLQVWRPRARRLGSRPTYELVCQRQVTVPDNVTQSAHEVAQPSQRSHWGRPAQAWFGRLSLSQIA